MPYSVTIAVLRGIRMLFTQESVQVSPVLHSLEEFVTPWLQDYKQSACSVELFDPEQVKRLSPAQRAFLAKAFYHVRGHFHDFLWFIGNRSKPAVKRLILENLEEEFWGDRSHEEFYYDFAASLGVDLDDEVVEQTTHLPFIREYNYQHMHWLKIHDADARFAAFAAYERLDNPDYENLYNLGVALGQKGRSLVFFDVHRHVEHYEATTLLLNEIWQRNPQAVTDAFTFIGSHQLQIWQKLSRAVFSYNLQLQAA
jgi:Iron-containing redox enzyme